MGFCNARKAYGHYKNLMGITRLIANYRLIDRALSDPYTGLKRGAHPIQDGTIH